VEEEEARVGVRMIGVVRVADWSAETDIMLVVVRSVCLKYIMVLEVGLPLLKKIFYGWEPTVWEAREEYLSIQEGVVEVIFLGVEGIIRVVEEEVVTQIRSRRATAFSSKERTVETGNLN